jgi:hypothetical protein
MTLSIVPASRTDLILRKINVNRYDDRDLVRTKLVRYSKECGGKLRRIGPDKGGHWEIIEVSADGTGV